MPRKKKLEKKYLFEGPNHFPRLLDAMSVSQYDAFGDPSLDDATVVLQATSIIDELLKFTIATRFRVEPSQTSLAEVFEGNGPLATFSAKITLASVFAIVRGDARHDLKILRKIRNDFAHSPKRLTFSGDKRCMSLKMRDTRWPDIKPVERQRFVESVSSIFLHCCVACAAALVEEHLMDKYQKEATKLTHEFIQWVQSDGKGKTPF
jgi:hypothetical protein